MKNATRFISLFLVVIGFYFQVEAQNTSSSPIPNADLVSPTVVTTPSPKSSSVKDIPSKIELYVNTSVENELLTYRIINQSRNISSNPVRETTTRCSSSVIAEVGLFSSYNGADVGETFHKPRVVQGWTELEVCSNKKISYGLNFWGSVSMEENPSVGTEGDVVAFTVFRINQKTNVRFEAGVFYVVGGEISKFGGTLSRDFNLSDSIRLNVRNNTSYFRTTNSLGLPGGIINKTTVSFSRSLFKKKADLSIAPAVSIDNNPFGLGKGSAVAMGFLNLRLDIPLNNRITFFLTGILSNPILGDTNREFRKSGGFGFSFILK